MRFACYINKNSERILVDSKVTGKMNFLEYSCPLCEEKVELIDGEKRHYFRHHKGLINKDCENYLSSDSDSELYISTINLNSLYLIREFNNYKLAIGFPGISEETILKSEKLVLEFNIQLGRNKTIQKNVNRSNFTPKIYEFITVDGDFEEYIVKYNTDNLPKEIQKKWPIKVAGLGMNGAFFHKGDYSSKKVSCNDGIVLNKEYYLIHRRNLKNEHIKGMNIKEIGNLDFNQFKTFRIYEFYIDDINNEIELFLSNFALEIKPEALYISSIWPPSIYEDERNICLNKSNLYFSVNKTSEEEHLLFNSYKLKKANREIDGNLALYKTDIVNKEVIEIKHFESMISNVVERMDDYCIEQNDIELYSKDIKSENNIQFNIESKVFVNTFYDDLLTDSKIYKKGEFEISIEKRNYIEILYGVDVVECIRFNSNKKLTNKKFDIDDDILKIILKYSGELVTLTDADRWEILRYKIYDKSFNELKRRTSNNKIPLNLLRRLRVIKKMEDNYE